MPTAILFKTSEDGSASPTEKLRITSAGKVCINNDNALSDLHVCTAGSSEQDGTFRIGGNGAGVGLVLDYDQSGQTLSRIMANDSYTNSSALLKISVDGDLNTNQLVLKGDGNVGIGTDTTDSKLGINVGTAVSAFDIQGSQGQLFSVTNSISSGSIFAVNDVSGIPSIDVDADGTIKLAPFGTNEKVGIGTTSPTYKVDVVGGDLRVGRNNSHGIILTSPNGTKYRLKVANNGTLSTTAV